MKSEGKDKVVVNGNTVKHESAGGFLFYNSYGNRNQILGITKP